MTPPAAPGWAGWQRLSWKERLSKPVLAEILDGGQAFRWRRESGEVWEGSWSDHRARLALDPEGRLLWSAPDGQASGTGPALETYFDASRGAGPLNDPLPWRGDSHLARCMAAFPGLRVLRQPFGETLLCFLCSPAKQIVQIKQAVGLLASRHGASGALPSWEEISRLPEAALRGCLLGFRARHIHRTALHLAAHPGWLEITQALPYAQARERLCDLPGVGEKIADCVLLFGAGRLEAFPVDVWILKAMARRYGLHGWKPAQIAQFGRVHFGPHAGLAQQYLFAWERSQGRSDPPSLS